MSVPSYPHLLTGWTFVRVSSCLWRAAEHATPKYDCRSWGHATAKCAALAYYLELWALENQQMQGEVCSECPYRNSAVINLLPGIWSTRRDDSCHRKGEEKSIPRLDSLSCRLSHLSSIFLRAISSVQFSRSVMSDSATPWTTARQASLSITNSRSPPKPMSIELVMPSNHLILYRLLLLLPSIFTSIRVFSNESALCIRWPKYWSFSFNISPSNEHPGLPSVCPKNHLLSPKGSTRLPRWLSGKEYTCQCRRHGSDPWSMKIPWRRKWQPTPVFLPGKFHGQRSLVSYSPWGCKRVRHDVD